MMGDQATLDALLSKDQSYDARWQKITSQMNSWLKDNPVPPVEASAEERTAYWEKRLKAADTWTKGVPEESRFWLERLRALSELPGHSDNEFLATADKVLEIERSGDQSFVLSGSSFLSVASYYVKRGVRLNQVAALIDEAKAGFLQQQRRIGLDLGPAPQVAPFSASFQFWQQTDDVWNALLEAYVRAGRRDRARQCLETIQSGINEARKQLIAYKSGLITVDRKWQTTLEANAVGMSSMLAAREQHYNEASARLR
jgi:pentatricopeptide repeat protein